MDNNGLLFLCLFSPVVSTIFIVIAEEMEREMGDPRPNNRKNGIQVSYQTLITFFHCLLQASISISDNCKCLQNQAK